MLKSFYHGIMLCVAVLCIAANEYRPAASTKSAQDILLKDERAVTALRLFTQEILFHQKNNSYDTVAEDMYWISECLFQMKQYPALERVLQAAEPFAKRHNPDAYYKLLITASNYLIEKGEHDEAITLLNSIQSNDLHTQCSRNFSLGNAYFISGKLEKGKLLFLQVVQQASDSLQTAQALNGLGSYFYLQTKIDSARYYFEKALLIYQRQLGTLHSKSAQVIFNIGLLAGEQGDYYTSKKDFSQVLDIYLKKFGEYHPRTAEAYAALGGVYMNEDNVEKALLYFIKDKTIQEKLYGSDHPDIIYSYLNCGTAYYQMNDLQNAETALTRALSLCKENYTIQHHLYSQCAIELSKVYIDKKQFAEAEKILSDVIEQHQQQPDEFLADAYLQYGNALLAQQKNKEAIEYFTSADKWYVDFFGEKNIYSSDVYNGISDAYLALKQDTTALRYADKALLSTVENSKILYPYDHWECLLQKIVCMKALYVDGIRKPANITTDIELIKRTINEAEQIKQTYYSTGSQLHYSEKMGILNELGIFFLTHYYPKKDAYFLDNILYFAENNKANLLNSKVTSHLYNDILPIEEQSISTQITGKLNYFISLSERNERAAFNINDSILFYQNLYEQFTKKIEKEYPKIYSIKYGDAPLNIRQVQDKLRNEYTFLEYFNDGENYYCLSVSGDHVAFKSCGSINYIDSLFYRFQNSVTEKQFDRNTSIVLYRHLLPAQLDEYLVISGDGIIPYISFDALCSGQHAGKDFLLYNHATAYTFSAGTYFRHTEALDSKRVLAFYPDFTHSSFAILDSKREHEALKAFSEYEVYYHEQASKDMFIQKSSKAGIIHLASHLLVDTTSPLQSSLVFEPKKNNLLSIQEIWKLHTDAQLVTLAACRSNFGKQQYGEGIQSFAWAFQYAGAHHILTTQWNAADKSTGTIIGNFYTALKKGTNGLKALQQAKINYLEQADAIGAQPFFWANYTLYGDETAISVSPKFLSIFWWLPVVLLLSGFILFLFYRKLFTKNYIA